ncbi:hypothetical protein [Roseovarius pacificus]|uniref:hypothetical protein n=1 Tax=Roseovarius pacificus TaxID=337701 RepID=UPI0040399A3B
MQDGFDARSGVEAECQVAFPCGVEPVLKDGCADIEHQPAGAPGEVDPAPEGHGGAQHRACVLNARAQFQREAHASGGLSEGDAGEGDGLVEPAGACADIEAERQPVGQAVFAVEGCISPVVQDVALPRKRQEGVALAARPGAGLRHARGQGGQQAAQAYQEQNAPHRPSGQTAPTRDSVILSLGKPAVNF